MADKTEKPVGTTLEERMDKALETALLQFMSNLKPSDALAQAEAIKKMTEARQILLLTNMQKEVPKK